MHAQIENKPKISAVDYDDYWLVTTSRIRVGFVGIVLTLWRSTGKS